MIRRPSTRERNIPAAIERSIRGLLVLLLALVALPALAAEPTSRLLTMSDGMRVHVLEAGQGPPVILLHGSSGDSQSNYVETGIFQALAERHRVIAMDFRGQGRSDRPTAPRWYASDAFPRDILEVMNQLGVRRAHFAGYSMGGEMLAPLLALAPERILTATFGGSGLLEPDPRADAAALTRDAKGRDRDPPPLAAKLWKRENLEALRAMEEGRRRKPFTTPPIDPRRIGFPILAIIGEYDTPNRFSSLMRRTLPTYRLVVLPGRGHGTALADPRFKTELIAFIDANDPR
jgi:pimeloyl-ACP methyl ester carboxylesterase